MLKKKIVQAIEPASEAKSSEKAVAPKSKKNKMSLAAVRTHMAKWGKELKSEYKKIVWPTKRQIWKNTAVVLVVLVAVGILVGLLDFGFQKLILEQLLKLVTGY
jgi:preprotein translocase subunit SecE